LVEVFACCHDSQQLSDLCRCLVDDGELEMLAMLVEQEASEHQSGVSRVTATSVSNVRTVPESAACSMTSGSTVDSGKCSENSEPMDNTEKPVTETDEQCKYFCHIFTVQCTLYMTSPKHATSEQ